MPAGGVGGAGMRSPHLIAAACTASDPADRYHRAEEAIWEEYAGSLVAFPRTWLSLEEGAMVLAEEIDEVWDEVRANHLGRAHLEAAQAGAMALRLIADLYEHSPDPLQRGRVAAAEVSLVRPLVGPRGRALASSHEGYGFLKREFDALWSAIRFDDPARELAARVAATSVRFIAETTSARTALAVVAR